MMESLLISFTSAVLYGVNCISCLEVQVSVEYAGLLASHGVCSASAN